MKNKKKLGTVIIASVLFLVTIFFIINYFNWKNNYQNRVLPGVTLGGLPLGGKTQEGARQAIINRFQEINLAGLSFQYANQLKKLEFNVVSFDSDLARQTLSFDPESSLALIFNEKNQNSFFYYISSLFKKKSDRQIIPVFSLDEATVKVFINENFRDLNIVPENAYFSLIKKGSNIKNVEIEVNKEKIGKGVDFDKLFKDIYTNLAQLESSKIIIKTVSLYPEVKQNDLSELKEKVKQVIGRGDLFITLPGIASSSVSNQSVVSDQKSWKIKQVELITWFNAKKENTGLTISLDPQKIKTYLEKEIKPEINEEAVLPKFEIKDGRVASWQTGKNGKELDLEASSAKIINDFFNGINNIELIVTEIVSKDLSNNDFKIEEIIGTGHSNFKGSSVNRRKNISVGASFLHGLLIKPDEEFSLINSLGSINEKSGYVQELVIKGDKTIPEFGGGLCQIGTTVFRTALSSGLPITMRQNHSYRVSYYEPAGTDATIYDPQPDLKFVNDTGNYILIQTRINNNDLYFDFWGIKDGRLASTTYPTIYNIVKPEPTKIIESENLKPGEKKCTESSHNGADAYFDYTVVYTDGKINEKRFKSHYVPWQAVCLIGKTASSSDPIAGTSTSSKNIITTSTPALVATTTNTQ